MYVEDTDGLEYTTVLAEVAGVCARSAPGRKRQSGSNGLSMFMKLLSLFHGSADPNFGGYEAWGLT
jgi:hypothetical protein